MSLMEKEMYEFGPYSLDPAERVILRDGACGPQKSVRAGSWTDITL